MIRIVIVGPIIYWIGILFMSSLAANQQFNRRAKAYFRTERPRNFCEDCGYDWFPRGRDRSLKCNQCGSTRTRIIPFPWQEWYELSLNVGKVFAFFFFPGLILLAAFFLGMGSPGIIEMLIFPVGAAIFGWPAYWAHKKLVNRKRQKYQLDWSPES